MAEGMLNMSRKDRERLEVMNAVKRKAMTLAEAAARMRVGYRQAKRIWARFAAGGASGLTHRGRGRPGPRSADAALRDEALALVQEHYADHGPTLASEYLARDHGIDVDHETLRRWMIAARMWTTRGPQRVHRKKRERRAKFGDMGQMDGSPHPWLEDRADACCLMVMIDDATSQARALFVPQECTEGAMRLLLGWIREFGIPKAIYVDRKNTFVAVERVDGRQRPTTLGRICERLGIEIIAANSPQAKGRVERCNRTLQDRLVKALRHRGIDDLESANRMLGAWMKLHSKSFSRPPADPADGHRSARGLDLGAIFAWEEDRTVNRDHTVRHDNRWFQLPPDPAVRPGSKVIVRRRLDGRLQILTGDRALKFRELKEPPAPPPAPARPVTPRKSARPAPDHPWRGKKGSGEPDRMESGALPPNPQSLSLEEGRPMDASRSARTGHAGKPSPERSAKVRTQKGPDPGPGPTTTPSARPPSRRSGRSSAEPYPPDGHS